MGDILQSNSETTDNHSNQLKSIADCFENTPLVTQDLKTNIRANDNFKEAYAQSQTLIDKFGDVLNTDTENIRKIGLEFKQMDELCAELMETGHKGPTIGPAK